MEGRVSRFRVPDVGGGGAGAGGVGSEEGAQVGHVVRGGGQEDVLSELGGGVGGFGEDGGHVEGVVCCGGVGHLGGVQYFGGETVVVFVLEKGRGLGDSGWIVCPWSFIILTDCVFWDRGFRLL